MGLFGNFGKTPSSSSSSSGKRIKYVVEYECHGQRGKVIDYFNTIVSADPAEVRRYLERKLGTYQFTVLKVYEY